MVQPICLRIVTSRIAVAFILHVDVRWRMYIVLSGSSRKLNMLIENAMM